MLLLAKNQVAIAVGMIYLSTDIVGICMPVDMR